MSAERQSVDAATQKATVIPEALSSIQASHTSTIGAPTYAAPVHKHQHELKVGDRIHDFELVRELGRGGFATVYLARQVSLGRLVALKVGPNRGREAQTLASLEHDHIVHVFSESVDEARQARFLCMQYVAGATLADVMQQLSPEIRSQGNGSDYLAALDRISKHTDEFRPSALQERQALAEGTFFEAVCWIGAKLSSALQFAHDQGVLHRDIKPANILVNAYGRPFLADFNLASNTSSDHDVLVGGTLPYMSPEHLRAFISRFQDDWNFVGVQSDLYSLGVVLYELLTGKRPYSSSINPQVSREEALQGLLAKRMEPVAPLSDIVPTIPHCLDMVIRSCLSPNPITRYQSASELGKALEACRLHLRSLHQLPPPPAWVNYFHSHPFISLLLIPTATNVVATLVNWTYNLTQVVGDLSVVQKHAFDNVVLVYNLVAFPVLVGITWFLLCLRHREWKAIHDGRLATTWQVATLRRHVNFLATWSILGSLIGWLPGGIVFPVAIHFFGEPLKLEDYLHFALSFTLSGMIAITYCYLGSQYVVLRVLLPSLCGSADQGDNTLRRELKRLPGRLMFFQTLAGIIPLTGALLIVMIGHTSQGDNWFRLLVCMLIVFGMVGFVFALQITQYLQRVLNILLNPERRNSEMYF